MGAVGGAGAGALAAESSSTFRDTFNFMDKGLLGLAGPAGQVRGDKPYTFIFHRD